MSESSKGAVDAVKSPKPQPGSGGGLLFLLVAAASAFLFYRNGES